MLKALFCTVTLVVFTFSSTQSVAVPALVLKPIELPSNFQYPNGIARTSNGTLYVGSVTSGRILLVTPKGKIETFFPGSKDVFAATSLRLDEQRGILWGTSPDFLGVRGENGQTIRRLPRIFAIDINSGKVLRAIVIPKGSFGNDIALDGQGGVYITDSTRPRIYYLSPRKTQFQIWTENKKFQSEEIGLAGIARDRNDVIIVGLYSEGKLYKVTPLSQGNIKVEAIPLERKLENPDGMQFAADGSLLLTEGAVASGNGRLVRIDVLSPGTKPKSIETIAENMESPVNLTVAGRQVWVTESRIRHRLLPGKEKEIPDRFFIRRFRLRTVND